MEPVVFDILPYPSLKSKDHGQGARDRVAKRLIPTGECWCGCGEEARRGSFFLPGHDKVAESAVVAIEYGGVAQLLDRHGFDETEIPAVPIH
jgi:hypothetical protein